jgi:four helix bundle protein
LQIDGWEVDTVSTESEQLAERILIFAVYIIDLTEGMPNTVAGRHIGGQLLRSGTSVAANYEEACAAESRADFIHKLQIVLKEARETRLWLRLISRSSLGQKVNCAVLSQEADELCLIFAQSVVTAKRKIGKLTPST